MNRVLVGDASAQLAVLKAEGVKVQMCVTSPPYFGLRDYGTATWQGGDPACSHTVQHWDGPKQTQGAQSGHSAQRNRLDRQVCDCGAVRVDQQVGLEDTPEAYIERLVGILRGVWDVLADDGTLWLNLGDSYAGGGGGNYTKGTRNNNGQNITNIRNRADWLIDSHLKPKDLIGIPWRVALALQADGWYLRQDIIWMKPNPMPESVTDRCTKSHEYLFLLTKSPRYFFDHEAIKEPATCPRKRGPALHPDTISTNGNSGLSRRDSMGQRNKRDVWTIATRGYKGAHFAVFPPQLIEPCILAGTSAAGHCPACGRRWVRDVVKTPMQIRRTERPEALGDYGRTQASGTMVAPAVSVTRGWKATCTCGVAPVPDVVLDPFFGSGTTGQVAVQHGRQYLGIELNPAYVPLQQERLNGARS